MHPESTNKRKSSQDNASATCSKDVSRRKRNKRVKKSEKLTEEGALISNQLFGNADIAAIIFLFLKVRELLRFLSCSKQYGERLNHEIVVRSAMMTGGFAKQSMERLIPLLETRSIWTPTPRRLLRLMCGKRCELCNGYKVNRVNGHYGIFVCFNRCIEKSSHKVAHNNTWMPYTSNPRVAQARFRNISYLWRKDIQDNANRENIGPLVTLSSTCRSQISNFLETCDQQQPNAQAQVNEIINVFRGCENDANTRQFQTLEKKAAGKKAYAAARLKNNDSLLEKVAKLLKPSEEQKNIPFLEMVQSRRWISKKNIYCFSNPVAQNILGPAVAAPSKVTKKKLKELAERLVQALEHKFHIDSIFATLLEGFEPEQRPSNCFNKHWDWKDNCYSFHCSLIQNILQDLKDPTLVTPEKIDTWREELRELLGRKQIINSNLEVLLGMLDKDYPFIRKQVMEQISWDNQTFTYYFRPAMIRNILQVPMASPRQIDNQTLHKLAHNLLHALERNIRVEKDERLARVYEQLKERFAPQKKEL
jgi:hypothetical protein